MKSDILLFRTLLAGLILAAVTVGPAAAEDCFIKVRVPARPIAAPARHAPRRPLAAAAPRPPRPHPVRHRLGPHRPAKIHAAAASPAHPQFVESSLAQATVPVYELRPVVCDSQPAIRSVLPGAPKPTAQRLLDALAGPATAAAPAPQVAVAEPPPTGGGFPGFPTDSGPPGVIGGVPGGIPGGVPGGVPGGGGPPPILPPGGGPPSILPPEGGPPPVLPPDGGPPPIVITPPGQPPIAPPDGGPPPILPPEGGLPPTLTPTPPVAGIPEPATWALSILGFFGLGGALRSQRRRRKVNL
jgi:hypothetical protein